jgi:hypothetical protein
VKERESEYWKSDGSERKRRLTEYEFVWEERREVDEEPAEATADVGIFWSLTWVGRVMDGPIHFIRRSWVIKSVV